MIEVCCPQCRLTYHAQAGMHFRCKCGHWLQAPVSIERFVCPNCKTAMTAPSEQAGQKVNCTKCGQRLQIPNRQKTILAQTLEEPPPLPRETRPIRRERFTIESDDHPRISARLSPSPPAQAAPTGIAYFGILCGFFSVAILFAGLFAPALRISPLGPVQSINFFDMHFRGLNTVLFGETPQTNILIVLGLAGVSAMIFAAARVYALVGVCGGVTLVTLMFAAARSARLMEQFASNVGENAQWGWGWGLLFFGGLLMLLTGWMPRR